jgi:hypothetical protein
MTRWVVRSNETVHVKVLEKFDLFRNYNFTGNCVSNKKQGCGANRHKKDETAFTIEAISKNGKDGRAAVKKPHA